MTLYLTSIILFCLWFSTVDAARTLRLESPKWIMSDFTYLAGLAFTTFFVVCAAHNFHAPHFYWFTVATFLIGLEFEDCSYGLIVYHDALAPYPDYAFGLGFTTKTARINFDMIVKIIPATIIYYCIGF